MLYLCQDSQCKGITFVVLIGERHRTQLSEDQWGDTLTLCCVLCGSSWNVGLQVWPTPDQEVAPLLEDRFPKAEPEMEQVILERFPELDA